MAEQGHNDRSLRSRFNPCKDTFIRVQGHVYHSAGHVYHSARSRLSQCKVPFITLQGHVYHGARSGLL
jgi:hypothetical protein